MTVFTESPTDHALVHVHGSDLDYVDAKRIARHVGGIIMFTDQFQASIKRGERKVMA